MKTKHREKFFLIMVSSLTTLAIFFPYTTFCVNNQAGSDNSVTNTIIIEIIIISIIIALLFTHIKRKNKSQTADADALPIPEEAISHYHEVRKQREDQEYQLNQKKFVAVSAYVQLMLSPYMKESDVKIVCNNIKSWITNEDAAIVSVSTDGRLGSIDLRHLVWNIGERFNWKGEKRALFAKMVFPIELRDIEVSTIRRNLRQRGTCIIDLDIPEKGDYRFSFQLI